MALATPPTTKKRRKLLEDKKINKVAAKKIKVAAVVSGAQAPTRQSGRKCKSVRII
jgi:hypothetical protein